AFGLRSARRQAAALVVFGFLLSGFIRRRFLFFIIRPGNFGGKLAASAVVVLTATGVAPV
ncbi:hypothetical protein, partial [Klebsiella aerogenes]|uniref:hypothetical protein n=1 Tax=Klebsiella aerogenes TaxID=548 RepID=UPI00195305C6